MYSEVALTLSSHADALPFSFMDFLMFQSSQYWPSLQCKLSVVVMSSKGSLLSPSPMEMEGSELVVLNILSLSDILGLWDLKSVPKPPLGSTNDTWHISHICWSRI